MKHVEHMDAVQGRKHGQILNADESTDLAILFAIFDELRTLFAKVDSLPCPTSCSWMRRPCITPRLWVFLRTKSVPKILEIALQGGAAGLTRDSPVCTVGILGRAVAWFVFALSLVSNEFGSTVSTVSHM